MGAQYLPKRGGSDLGGVPSPYCTVVIYGDPVDAARFKTHTVPGNGFNPVWQGSFALALTRPETAFLYIGVHDQVDITRSSFLAYFCAPVWALRAGFRSCPLRNNTSKKIPLCSLLARFERLPIDD